MHPSAKLLQPPPPIMQTESNWPLLTVSKGFFEGMSAKGGASMKLEPEDQDVVGWGDDDDLVIDDGRTLI